MSKDTHPSLPEFDYILPETLAEASDFLVQHPNEARPFTGGTDTLVRMRDGLLSPKFLVDIKHLEGMQVLHFDPKTGLTLGAAVAMNRIIDSPDVREQYPLLAKACRSVASYQLRNRATIAGNICNASPAGDTIGACLVLNGVLQVHGVGGFRKIPLSDFFLGPGKTRLKPGDIVTAIQLPVPPKGSMGNYQKLGRNKLGDLAIVGVTVLGHPDRRFPSGFRIRVALTSVAPVPLLLSNVETYLGEKPITNESLKMAAQMAADTCSPIDDIRASARYRKQMVKNLAAKALSEVWEMLKN